MTSNTLASKLFRADCRRLAVITAVVATAALTSCAATGKDAPPSPPPSVTFAENGVTVNLTVIKWKAHNGTVQVKFTPDKAGFHLYSTALPAGGIEGVGRPTAVSFDGGLTASKRPTASEAVRTIHVPGVTGAVPVYPDGPVTLTVPVHASTGKASALVSYASCSITEGCSLPVKNHPVAIHITADGITFEQHR
ncbi:hypothetical protein ACFYPT_40635 [Streptomyces sp. NPDC005529]|uniref:hypothetical protein n=1 Tax=unclassified Streptomyces TaxID=2593676 RepID=UPI0033B5E8C8